MHLTLVGLSHKTAPVEIREKLTFPANRQENALSLLCCGDAVNEAVIVSTCNRTEVYAVTSEGVDGASAIIDFMCDYHDLDRHDLVPYLYLSEGEAVVRHLFRVVASLDSMVLGEAQILGQVKEAYEHSFEAGGSQRIFNKLFRQSFEVGKRVRTETEIGENAVSISYAAVELAKKVFESLEGRTILVVGAGKMSELTAKHLVSNGVRRVLVANRTFARAEELAEHRHLLPPPRDLTSLEQARRFSLAGADILDVGGESTRPGAQIVSAGEEIERVIPIIQALEGRRVFEHLNVEENLNVGAFARKDRQNVKSDLEMVYNYFPRLKERQNVLAGFIETDDRTAGIVGTLVDIQNVFHLGHEATAYGGDAPGLDGPRTQPVFLSRRMTVTSAIWST